MKASLVLAIVLVASAFAANNDDDFTFIKNINKIFDDCGILRDTVKGKCPGLIPEPECLVCVLKGCYPSITQDNLCKNLNKCAAKNPSKC